MSRFLRYILLILVVVGLHGCASRKKNSATTRAYHSFTARYNTYYNGSVAFRQGNVSQVNGHKDNYLEQLPLLIVSDKQTQKNGASNYDKAIEKAQKESKSGKILIEKYLENSPLSKSNNLHFGHLSITTPSQYTCSISSLQILHFNQTLCFEPFVKN